MDDQDPNYGDFHVCRRHHSRFRAQLPVVINQAHTLTMKARLNTTLMIIGLAAVSGCASVAILAIELYHRFYEPACNSLDAGEREELLDEASKILDEAKQLINEVDNDIADAQAETDALQEFSVREHDGAEHEQRKAAFQSAIEDIKIKITRIDSMNEQVERIINIVESHDP